MFNPKHHTVKITITDKDGIVLMQTDYNDFVREITISDLSNGYDAPNVTIEEFAEVVKEEIIKEFNRINKEGEDVEHECA